jgi:hypothetical protein
MKISEDLKLKSHYALGYFSLGELYILAGQKEKALDNLEKLKPCSRKWALITGWP